MAVYLDLSTRIVPPGRQVMVVRPGARYHLAGTFEVGNVAGPDLPDIDWSSDDEAHQKVAKIKRSVEIRSWIMQRRPPERQPPGDLDSYDGYTTTPSSRQLLRVAQFFFEDARRGDLIVVPPESLAAEAAIGEFVTGSDELVNYVAQRYEPTTLMGRRVRWIGKLPKKALPGNILEALRHPSALLIMPRQFVPRIYQEAYGSYSADGRFVAEFEVQSERYTVSDDINALGFFKFVAYNSRQVDRRLQERVSVEQAAFADVGDYAPDLSIEISSPGFLTIASQYLVPLVASALFALAVQVGPPAFAEIQAGTLTIGNSAAPADDPCAQKVQEHIYDYMMLLGADRWARACEIAREAAQNNGLRSNSKVIP